MVEVERLLNSNKLFLELLENVREAVKKGEKNGNRDNM